MVISAESPGPPPDPTAGASAPARAESQSNLHNFTFPIIKKWGSQRVLRCLHVNRKGETIRSPPPISRSAPIRQGDAPPEQVREKLIAHHREPEGRFKLPEAVTLPAAPPQPPGEVAPWNLRARRTPVKDPSVSPPRAAGSHEERGAVAHVRTVRLRSEDVEKRGRAKFSITLTREEIDEDIYAMTGSRARRRPKKRPKNVQKQLDVSFQQFLRVQIFQFCWIFWVLIDKSLDLLGWQMLFPGSWLSEITADSYKVPD